MSITRERVPSSLNDLDPSTAFDALHGDESAAEWLARRLGVSAGEAERRLGMRRTPAALATHATRAACPAPSPPCSTTPARRAPPTWCTSPPAAATAPCAIARPWRSAAPGMGLGRALRRAPVCR